MPYACRHANLGQILEALVQCAQDEDEKVSETIHKCAENVGLYVEV